MEESGVPAVVAGEDLEFETSKGVKPILSFDNMKLKPLLIKGIYTFGFEKPSAIQQRAIVPITQGWLSLSEVEEAILLPHLYAL